MRKRLKKKLGLTKRMIRLMASPPLPCGVIDDYRPIQSDVVVDLNHVIGCHGPHVVGGGAYLMMGGGMNGLREIPFHGSQADMVRALLMDQKALVPA